MIALNTDACIDAQVETIPKLKMKRLKENPMILVRHCKWFLRAERIAVACALARMALELHLKEIATARVKHRRSYPKTIAQRLRDAGWITIEEAGAAAFAYDVLSAFVHDGKSPASPVVAVSKAIEFVEATTPKQLKRRGRRPVVA